MDHLRGLRFFVRAVELGSLSAVAREEGVTQPTVSKVIAALERDLAVRLLERSTTSLVPTVAGLRFQQRAKGVLEEYAAAVLDARGQTTTPAGLLRINAPVALGQFHLNGAIRQFLLMYPDIELELILNDRFVDLVEEGVDVAVRLGDALPQDAVARRVALSPRLLAASPAYLKQYGTPSLPQDLQQHEVIRYAWLADDGGSMELSSGAELASVPVHGRYRVNHALAIRDSLLLGAGIGLCPAWLVADLLADGRLVLVLPEWSGAAQQLSLLYPTRRYQPLRARLFIDFLAGQVRRWPGFETVESRNQPR